MALDSFQSKRAEPGLYVDALPWEVHSRKLEQILEVYGDEQGGVRERANWE